ncbi:MAG: EAL domain-containing protein [Burkholderiales bacterium]|jgi:diguanylate cyclase (GGDEF)-like protein|nr:EAL domain-containing protein [Burkholderiales bacterium]
MAFDPRASDSRFPNTTLVGVPTLLGRAPTVLGGGEGEGTAAAVGGRDAADGDGSAPPAADGRPTAAKGRALRWLPRQLASGVGRRLLATLVLTALIPVALMAGLSFLQVSDAMRRQQDSDLLQSARAYAATVVDRLRWIDSLVAVAASSTSPAASLSARLGRELDGYVVYDRKGRLLGHGGRQPPQEALAKAPDSGDRRDRRPALLSWLSADGPAQALAYAFDGAESVGSIAVTLSPEFAWQAAALDGQQTVFCAATASGERLACAQPVPQEALLQLASAEPADGQRLTRFALDGVEMRAGGAVIEPGAQFRGPTIVVAAARQDGPLLEPTGMFRKTFLPIAVLSVLLVLMLSLVEVRRILMPLHAVLDGMRRVAARDFGSPVPVTDRDEFGQMAESFNAMTAQLGLHFRTLSAFAEIDRTILTTVDIRQVAEIALDCIHEISRIKVVSLGLLEADTPDCTKVYLRASDGTTLRDELPRALDLSGVDASLRKWSRSIRLPSSYRTMLHEHGAKFLYLLPIARAGKVWGVVVLGHDEKTALSGEQALALAGVIDRLAVALSSVARDKQLHDQAHFDSLTGLPNRHYLMDMLAQQVAHARSDNSFLAVLYIDLDRFKRTNDTLGHAAGDVLLRHAAARIRRAVRDIDIVARLGGDEFTVVLTRLKEARDAGSVARTLIAALNEPFELDGHVIYAGASIGISIFPKDGLNGAELLKKADTALYLAKDRGRGRHAFFEERMNADASARVTIDRELREALKRSEFLLHYQPQIDLATGEVCAVEALLRWQHPHRGLLVPEAFIDHAEDSGLIEAIGTWVLREACQQHRRWVEAGVVIPRVSVNVSALQLRNSSFAATVEAALNSSTTPSNYLELEVTESLLFDAGPDAVATLERLRERGVEIAVDDFGTGYSSFAYVKQLPANILKLDRTFIVDVVDNPQAAIIATAIIEMANALGKIVVAEGVETLQQAQFLRRYNCARAQGFVFSAALPPELIPDFVREREREAAAIPLLPDLKLPSASRVLGPA